MVVAGVTEIGWIVGWYCLMVSPRLAVCICGAKDESDSSIVPSPAPPAAPPPIEGKKHSQSVITQLYWVVGTRSVGGPIDK